MTARRDVEARAADERFRACVELRPVGDVELRVGVKDTVDVAGFATRLGTRRHRRYPESTAAVLRGLPAGAVNAKLATTELSIGIDHGCVNPYFPHLDPAGSSTGCAVAVAADICDLAMGTDSVASVRLPASACGVVGLRLTHDRRLLDGVFQLSPHLDAPGWLTRTADELASYWQRYDLTGGIGPRQGDPPGRLRIGVVAEALEDDLDPEIRAAFTAACDALAAAGHEVREVRLGRLFHDRGLAYQLCAREAADLYRSHASSIADVLTESTGLALKSGAAVDDRRYAELLEIHGAHRREAAERFAADGLDAWLMPAGTMMPRNLHTESGPASTIPDVDEPDASPRVNYAAMASFLGLPSITFPTARSARHAAPIGLQAVGPQWTERVLVELARVTNELTGGVRFTVGGEPGWTS